MQPRPERPPSVEAAEVANCCEKRLLCDVLGGCRIVYDEIGSPVGLRPVVPEQRLQIGN
jgi:hypothetical protein